MMRRLVIMWKLLNRKFSGWKVHNFQIKYRIILSGLKMILIEKTTKDIWGLRKKKIRINIQERKTRDNRKLEYTARNNNIGEKLFRSNSWILQPIYTVCLKLEIRRLIWLLLLCFSIQWGWNLGIKWIILKLKAHKCQYFFNTNILRNALGFQTFQLCNAWSTIRVF